jgi:CBS domain-containing protein
VTTPALDLRVDDLMTIDPVTVSAEATIEEAEELLRRNQVSGLPVTDAAGRLVGVISQTDLLYLVLSSVQALIRHRASGIRVGEIMSTPAVTIDGELPIVEAARVMSDRRLHRLVAVDGSGRPIGVLSATDFVTLYAER